MKNDNDNILDHLSSFEIFFQRSGFKRIDGKVFGLLVLAKEPLASEEIEEMLDLSQSAVSTALKNLSHFNAIDTKDCREKRCKLHCAKENSLNIIASIFRKREQQNIEDFKHAAIKMLKDPDLISKETPRKRRLESIITSCEMAESVMNFVIALGQLGAAMPYNQILKRLPLAFELVSSTATPVANLTTQFAHRIKDGLFKSSGED